MPLNTERLVGETPLPKLFPTARQGVRVAAETGLDEEARMEAERKVAEKFANFRSAVKLGKDRIEESKDLREKRYEVFHECSTVVEREELEGAAQAFIHTEEAALRARRKGWSTEDFDAVCQLGSGAFGTVHLVKQKGADNVFALKQMKKSRYQRKNYRDRAYAERDLLGQATTRWFVELVATFQDADHVFMLMEFVQGGELFKYLELKDRLSPDETRFYMGELLLALDVVHRHGFVHRDVKPDNIMLTSGGHLKLLDFGLCKAEAPSADELRAVGNTRRARLQSKVGTPQYMAPEAFQGEATAASDLWALGVVTFECLYGGVPFHAGEKDGMEAISIISVAVKNHASTFPKRLHKARANGFMPPDAERLLRGIICSETVRLNGRAIRDEPFFGSLDFETIHSTTPPIVPQIRGALDVSMFDDSTKRAVLPKSRKGIPKDASLEWAHYEFDRKTRELERPEVVKQHFFNPTSRPELDGSGSPARPNSQGSAEALQPQQQRASTL